MPGLRAKYEKAYPECYAKYCAYHNPGSAAALLQEEKLWTAVEKPEATRSSSGEVIQILKDLVPNLFGGSAEGVSYAIILSNILVPTINNMTIPKAFGREGK